MAKAPKCGDCKFFERQSAKSKAGWCHRYPPQGTRLTYTDVALVPLPALQPTHRDHWCGEFVAAA